LKFPFSIQFPQPLVLLFSCVLLASFLSYVLPAGEFERQLDEATGRMVVVGGSYQEVESNPVNFFEAVVALPRGMAEAASVIFLVFLIGGAFTVLDETGTLRRGVSSLVRRVGDRELLIIPVVSILFAIGGVVENMQEEIIALLPPLLILTRRVGFSPTVAVAMSLGSAMVGSAFSPINPFQVQIALKLAELPLGSGGLFRLIFLLIALAIWIALTMRYAIRTRVAPEHDEYAEQRSLLGRDWFTLATLVTTFAISVWGMLIQGWGFEELAAAFFIMGLVVGGIGKLGFTGTAEAYIKGFKSMAYAAILIGFARAIFVVLQDGRIIDTIVNGLFTPLEQLPLMASSVGMLVAQAIIHVPVPSVSGQAVLTMPVLVPLSDLLGMSRQLTVLAYQYGAGLCEMITPTNGALMAILGIAGVRFENWLQFVLPLYLIMVTLGIASMAIALMIGL
jgi:uncharacterized ion transporter superfamily protein YfcC